MKTAYKTKREALEDATMVKSGSDWLQIDALDEGLIHCSDEAGYEYVLCLNDVDGLMKLVPITWKKG